MPANTAQAANDLDWDSAGDGLGSDSLELSPYLPNQAWALAANSLPVMTGDLPTAGGAESPPSDAAQPPTPPPPYAAQWTAQAGAWETAADWLESNPNTGQPEHYVPSFDNDVTIGNNGSSGYTITYNSTSTIWSINAGTVVTLDLQSGELSITYGGQVTGALDVESSATLAIGAGNKLYVNSGSYSGTLGGKGAIDFIGGAETIDTTSILIGTLELGVNGDGTGSTTTLDVSVTYSGIFLLDDSSGNNAMLDLDDKILTLKGTDTLDGTITGPGTVDITGAATSLGDFGVDGGATVVDIDGATITQNGDAIFGLSATSTGTLNINQGAVYNIVASAFFGSNDPTSAFVTNAGAMTVSGDSFVTLSGTFTNTGKVTIDAGSTLDLQGATDSLAGTITGEGELEFGSGDNPTIITANFNVATVYINGGNEGGTTTLGGNLSYAGAFEFESEFGYLDLNAKALTLTGAANIFISGVVYDGVLDVTGAVTQLSGTFGDSSGAVSIGDSGSIDQNGNVTLDGSLTVTAQHSYTITSVSNLVGGSSTIDNVGMLADSSSAGTSDVSAVFTDSGVVSVAANDLLDLTGTETFRATGSISGAGALQFGFAAQVTIDTDSISVDELLIAGGNGGGVTTFEGNVSYRGVFDFSNEFGTLNIASGKTLFLSGKSDSLFGGDIDGGGTIEVTGAAQFASTVGTNSATTIVDAGVIDQAGNVNLDGLLSISAHHTYDITTASNIVDDGATINILGTLADSSSGGTSDVSGVIANSGVVSVAANDVLDLGGTDTFRATGSISGAGALQFGFAAQVTVDTNSISVGEIVIAGGNGGGVTTFGGNISYGGVFDFSNEFGTLNIAAGKTLFLSGDSDSLFGGDIDGGGRIDVTGVAQFASTVGTNTATTIEDAGAIDQVGNVNLNGSLTIAAQHSYTITSAANVAGSGAGVANAGSFIDNSSTGTSFVSGSFTNTGSVTAQSGALVFNTEILGAGSEVIDAGGYLQLDSQSTASQTLTFNGAGAELGLGDAGQFQSSIYKFGVASSEAIDLIGFDANSQKTFETVSGGLIVNIADGSLSASLKFIGSYNESKFQLNTGSNGELLTY